MSERLDGYAVSLLDVVITATASQADGQTVTASIGVAVQGDFYTDLYQGDF